MSVYSPDDFRGNVVTSRIRLARNLMGHPFKITSPAESREIVKLVNRALVKCDTFNLYYTSNLRALELEAMKERNVISPNLIENKACGAALVNQDETISVMICEEDVLREQGFSKGFHLSEVYKRLEKIDDALCKNLDVAYDEKFGFLTACPTNLGTGLRASVMMFLPALTVSGKLGGLEREVNKLGLTIRGVYGEGSSAEGYMYQISNEITLGHSEYQIINAVESAVIKICEAEKAELNNVFGRHEITTLDEGSKAIGILENAVLLSYQDFLKYVSSIKICSMCGLIKVDGIEALDELLFRVRPASLCYEYGKAFNKLDRDLYRAKIVAQKIKKITKGR